MRRGILIGALGTLVISAAPAGAAEQRAALAAKFTPTKAGTASAPNPVATELTFSFPDASETNVPPRGRELDIALPEGFKYTGSGAAVCDFAKLQADGPSACPAGSQLGEGGASFYLVFPNFPVSGSTD